MTHWIDLVMSATTPQFKTSGSSFLSIETSLRRGTRRGAVKLSSPSYLRAKQRRNPSVYSQTSHSSRASHHVHSNEAIRSSKRVCGHGKDYCSLMFHFLTYQTFYKNMLWYYTRNNLKPILSNKADNISNSLHGLNCLLLGILWNIKNKIY